jgi:hypothetical protein
VDRIPNRGDLTSDEMAALRLIVAYSFMSKASMPASCRARLIDLGLIQAGTSGADAYAHGAHCAAP